jgi:hypothetical protein
MGRYVPNDRYSSKGLISRYAFSVSLYAAIAGVAYLSLAGPRDGAAPTIAAIPASMTVRELASDDRPFQIEQVSEARTSPVLLAIPALRAEAVPMQQVVPTARPAREPVARAMQATAAAGSTGVQMYDSCVPACESRDPMRTTAATYDEAPPPPLELVSNADEQPPARFSPLRSARHILGRTAALPETLVRGGRDVVERVVGVW